MYRLHFAYMIRKYMQIPKQILRKVEKLCQYECEEADVGRRS